MVMNINVFRSFVELWIFHKYFDYPHTLQMCLPVSPKDHLLVTLTKLVPVQLDLVLYILPQRLKVLMTFFCEHHAIINENSDVDRTTTYRTIQLEFHIKIFKNRI